MSKFSDWWDKIGNLLDRGVDNSREVYVNKPSEIGSKSNGYKLYNEPIGPTMTNIKNPSNTTPTIQTAQKQTAEKNNSWYDYSFDNHYADQMVALNKAMNLAKDNVEKNRDNSIASALKALQMSQNQYGVEAENLAAMGLSANGGFNENMQSKAYSAYRNFSAEQFATALQAMAEIDVAGSAEVADLARQRYEDDAKSKISELEGSLAWLQKMYEAEKDKNKK